MLLVTKKSGDTIEFYQNDFEGNSCLVARVLVRSAGRGQCKLALDVPPKTDVVFFHVDEPIRKEMRKDGNSPETTGNRDS